MVDAFDTVQLQIDHRNQFFFDDFVIEAVQDITRRFHRPTKVEGGPLITADRPWETVSYFSTNLWNVIWDRKDQLFKCWYTDWKFDREDFYHRCPRALGIHDFNHMTFRLLHAVSHDGLHWVKPPLGLVREEDHDTNIVLGGGSYGTVYCCSVFEDPFETNPERRLKTIYVHIMPQPASGDSAALALHEIRAAYSPDGIHWTPYEERPTWGSTGEPPLFDDVIIMSVDQDSRLYQATTRHLYRNHFAPNPRNPRGGSFIQPHYPLDPGREVRRRVWVSESADFLHWSEPYLILRPDEEDNLDDGFYGMAQLYLSSHRVGLLNVLHGTDNTMEVQLAFSRDGKRWMRAGQRQPFIQRGAPDSWDSTMVSCPSLPVRVGDELWIYYGGAKNHHDWWMTGLEEGLDVPEVRDLSQVRYGMGLAKLRADGFVSLHAGPVREGILVTRPFVSDGTRLIINASCGPGGFVDVEMVNAADEVLPGFSRAECVRFTGDSVDHEVTWHPAGGTGPAASGGGGGAWWASGKDYLRRLGTKHTSAPHRKLRFFMRNAHLYSFRLVHDAMTTGQEKHEMTVREARYEGSELECAAWLFVANPRNWRFQEAFVDNGVIWSGAKGHYPQKMLREYVRPGDRVMGYQAGPDYEICCELKVTSDPYLLEGTWAVDLDTPRWVEPRVSLATLKADPVLSGLKFVQIPILSITPITAEQLAVLDQLTEGSV